VCIFRWHDLNFSNYLSKHGRVLCFHINCKKEMMVMGDWEFEIGWAWPRHSDSWNLLALIPMPWPSIAFASTLPRHVGLMDPATSCPAGPARVLQTVTNQLPVPSPVAQFTTSLFLVMPLNNVIDWKQSDAQCIKIILSSDLASGVLN
jgi:hypothetical protein